MGLMTGCYVYTPVSQVGSGRVVLLGINDRGRVGIGQEVGAAAHAVEGTLTADPDSVYAVKVAAVRYLGGQTQRWTGEPLRISKDFVSDVREKRFSRSRSAMAAAAIVGGAVILILTRSLIGAGSTDRNPDPDGPGGET